ncbi:hypothetical protein Bca52824_012918 [Brassica carinata]|uniref:Thaumatin-like protein n=1 Tax=Brassica carinata TaxID=52824 RepID=A0A8X8B213_BRACI|nr:hypothetical protein Bca52824_012918 [Brassica carinata]
MAGWTLRRKPGRWLQRPDGNQDEALLRRLPKRGMHFRPEQICPNELSVRNGGSVVACKSACAAFDKPEFCCTGQFNQPETCPPTDYSRIFKTACPKAYSYAYDDATSTFTCANANYSIIFCPTI